MHHLRNFIFLRKRQQGTRFFSELLKLWLRIKATLKIHMLLSELTILTLVRLNTKSIDSDLRQMSV